MALLLLGFIFETRCDDILTFENSLTETPADAARGRLIKLGPKPLDMRWRVGAMLSRACDWLDDLPDVADIPELVVAASG
jgi:hypothetical protein